MRTVTNNIPAFLIILLPIDSPASADVPNRPSKGAVLIQLADVPNLHKINPGPNLETSRRRLSIPLVSRILRQ